MDIDFKAVLRDVRSKRAQRNPHIAVAAWNNALNVGQWVEYRSYPEAAPVLHRTRTQAEVLSGHTPVVWLHGKSGCVTLESCTPVEPPCTCLTAQLGPACCERHAA